MVATEKGKTILQLNANENVIVENVLFARGFVKNILSVACLADQGIQVILEDDSITLRHQHGSTNVLRLANDRLWHLNVRTNNQKEVNIL